MKQNLAKYPALKQAWSELESFVSSQNDYKASDKDQGGDAFELSPELAMKLNQKKQQLRQKQQEAELTEDEKDFLLELNRFEDEVRNYAKKQPEAILTAEHSDLVRQVTDDNGAEGQGLPAPQIYSQEERQYQLKNGRLVASGLTPQYATERSTPMTKAQISEREVGEIIAGLDRQFQEKIMKKRTQSEQGAKSKDGLNRGVGLGEYLNQVREEHLSGEPFADDDSQMHLGKIKDKATTE